MAAVNKKMGGRKVGPVDQGPPGGDAAAAEGGATPGGEGGPEGQGADVEQGGASAAAAASGTGDAFTSLAKKKVLRPHFDPHHYSR